MTREFARSGSHAPHVCARGLPDVNDVHARALAHRVVGVQGHSKFALKWKS